MAVQVVDERPHYTIRKIKNIGVDNKIDGKILYEDYELKGKKIRDEWEDENKKKHCVEYYEHIYPSPGKEIMIGNKKHKIHSIDIPSQEGQNKIINII